MAAGIKEEKTDILPQMGANSRMLPLPVLGTMDFKTLAKELATLGMMSLHISMPTQEMGFPQSPSRHVITLVSNAPTSLLEIHGDTSLEA